jgi:hypothetical protein
LRRFDNLAIASLLVDLLSEVMPMNTDFTICVGTVGAGVWFSPDGGEHWRRSRMNLPFEAERRQRRQMGAD